MKGFPLDEKFLQGQPTQGNTRTGFGLGLLAAGEQNEKVVALSADLRGSLQMDKFADKFPERFVEVGIAEQNMVCVAVGMAHIGYIPFTGSFAAFSPGRNYEQIRTAIALNNQSVKIIGSHTGVNPGEDGASNQMLEDIAMMRVMPNMVVIAPGDAIEVEKATVACANDKRPNYMRLTRASSPVFTTLESPFEIGRAYVLKEGKDITLLSTGTMTAQALIAAAELEKKKLSVEVVHVPTIKPLDETTILNSARKTGLVITIEEHQIAGGFGSAVAELLAEKYNCCFELDSKSSKKPGKILKKLQSSKSLKPLKFKRIGVDDQFGQSGTAEELLEYYGLTAKNIVKIALEMV